MKLKFVEFSTLRYFSGEINVNRLSKQDVVYGEALLFIDESCLSFGTRVLCCSREGRLVPFQAIPDAWRSSCGIHHQCHGGESQGPYEGTAYILCVSCC